MTALSKRSILTVVRWDANDVNMFSRAKEMTSRFFVCEKCPSGNKVQGSYFVGFVCPTK
jgi:hypothetical protein